MLSRPLPTLRTPVTVPPTCGKRPHHGPPPRGRLPLLPHQRIEGRHRLLPPLPRHDQMVVVVPRHHIASIPSAASRPPAVECTCPPRGSGGRSPPPISLLHHVRPSHPTTAAPTPSSTILSSRKPGSCGNRRPRQPVLIPGCSTSRPRDQKLRRSAAFFSCRGLAPHRSRPLDDSPMIGLRRTVRGECQYELRLPLSPPSVFHC